jgi:hypothetical protein
VLIKKVKEDDNTVSRAVDHSIDIPLEGISLSLLLTG